MNMTRILTAMLLILLTLTACKDDNDAPASYSPVETFNVNGVKFKMIRVEGGTFTMGTSTDLDTMAFDCEMPSHEVTVSTFCIGETEVTQELWSAVMESNPSYYADNLQYPVEEVSWNDCQTFIAELNKITGKQFRLPTEAEWEYAARGGKKSQGFVYAGGNTYQDVMWCTHNIVHSTNVVATKKPNELGIYDMSGNVWEWCQDLYGSYSSQAQTDPMGPDTGTERVLRGGGWSSVAKYCRVTYRSSSPPMREANFVGLRLAL